MSRQFEGDVGKYTGGDSMTAGEDCACVRVCVMPFHFLHIKTVKETLYRTGRVPGG